VFVTNFSEPVAHLAWFYNQRAGAENLIQEANNDAGLAARPVFLRLLQFLFTAVLLLRIRMPRIGVSTSFR
jgi:hypothetical protein